MRTIMPPIADDREVAGGPRAAAPLLSREELREVLITAMHAGQLMLENGANTARVEETVYRVGMALGADRLDAYVTPSGIIASAYSGEEHRTRIQRVTGSGVDLSRVAAVLDLSREAEAGRLGRAGVQTALERIAAKPRIYGTLATSLAVALGCAGFAVLFGGGIWDVLVVLLAAGLAQLARVGLLRWLPSRLLVTAVIAGLATELGLLLPLALAAIDLRMVADPALTIASSVLLLVPGVVMISSVADLFRGDTISGLARGTSALLALAAIAIGIWAALLISGSAIRVGTAAQPPLWLALPMAFMATAGFAVLFDVPPRALVAASLVGVAAYGTRSSLVLLGAPGEAAIFFAGVAIGVCAEVLARVLRTPTSIFSIPGFIVLVPGVLAFNTVLRFVSGEIDQGVVNLVQAGLIVGGLAAGLGTVGALVRSLYPHAGPPAGRRPVLAEDAES